MDVSIDKPFPERMLVDIKVPSVSLGEEFLLVKLTTAFELDLQDLGHTC